MESLAPGLSSGRAKQGLLDICPPHPVSCSGKDGCFLEVRNKPSAPGRGVSCSSPESGLNPTP